MKKKRIALLLSALMAVSVFAGCGEKAEEDAVADEKVLKIAAFKGGYGEVYWEKLKENFEKSHEGVTVELTVAPNLEETIRPQIQAGNVPDLIYLATGRPDALTETFIKEQSLTDISALLDMTVPGEDVKVNDKLLPGFVGNSVTSPYGDGKTYLAPLFYGPTGLFYNKALFKEKGYEVPKTWDEMFALGDKAKKDEISLFSYSTSGYFDCTLPPIIASEGGQDSIKALYNYSEGFWNTDAAKTGLETIAKMKDYLEPSVVANANNQNFKKNQQLVLDNKALFIPNGSWLPEEMKDAPRADGFEWGFTAYPATKDGGDQYAVNFIEQMYVPKDAENASLAMEFMAYMYSDEAVKIIAENAKGVVPVKGAIDIAKPYLDPTQVELFQVYDNGALPVIENFVATTPIEGLNYSDVYVGTIDSIMTGEKTVSDWQKSLIEASDKLSEAIIK